MSKESKLTKILEELADHSEAVLKNEEVYRLYIERFKNIDFDSKSKYFEILNFVVNNYSSKTISLSVLNENLNNLIEYCVELQEEESLVKNLKKVYDYLLLEFFREKRNQAIEAKSEDLTQQIEKDSKELSSLKKALKQSQSQYITILGIFASIVLAFVGGLTFSTSVLSHMHEVSIYRLVFVICCIGFLIFNTLFALFGFILRITEKEVDYCVFRVVNGVFVAIIIINALWYEYGGEDKKQSPKQEVNLSIQAKTK